MVNYVGGRSYVQIGKESTYGTPVTANRNVGIVGTVTPRNVNEIIESRGLGSHDLQQIAIGNFRYAFDIEGQYQTARLLEYALGTVAEGGGGGPSYVHTVTGNSTADLPSFTSYVALDSDTTDDREKYQGCMINSLSLSCELGDVVRFRAEVLAQDMISDATAAIPAVDTDPVLPSGVGGATAGGDAISQLRGFEWTVTNNLLAVDKQGAYIPDIYAQGNREYSGRVTYGFTDIQERARFFAGNKTATASATADFDGFATVLTYDKTAANASLILSLTDCHYTEYGKPVNLDGIVEQEYTVRHRTASLAAEDSKATIQGA